MEDSLLNRQGMRARDGVAVEECEELAKNIKEGPVGEQADALVSVDRAGACGSTIGGRSRGDRGGGGGLLQIQVQAQLCELPVGQTLLRVGLVELDGSSVHLKQGTCWLHHLPSAVPSCSAAAQRCQRGRIQ